MSVFARSVRSLNLGEKNVPHYFQKYSAASRNEPGKLLTKFHLFEVLSVFQCNRLDHGP
ncbi:protein of unknown function [Methylocaldum szegediense]|uniref:Transposase n=1 Tax=Methylocaldum szegediense TaxID=73780 RepID=A0ABN8X2H6_9GAMM|nr:protein of unknown function [Methylocaldum szegediense]